MTFLVHMRQSEKCGMMKYSTYIWELLQALESALSPASCKTLARKSKESKNEIQLKPRELKRCGKLGTVLLTRG